MSAENDHRLGTLLAVAAVVVVAGGCVTPAGPESSMAPFVQLEAEETDGTQPLGKLSASSGGRIHEERISGPVTSGSATWWLRDRYHLVGRATSAGAGLQGNLLVADTDAIRVGLVHGGSVNGGHYPDAEQQMSSNPWGLLTAGVFAQRSPDRSSTPYGGVRLLATIQGRTIEPSTLDLAIGWTTRLGSLQLGPEFMAGMPLGSATVTAVSLSMNMEATF